jgi:outer membrane receptor protein involved in Fe transport
VYGSYAFVDATLDKCTNPDEDGQCAFLDAGDRLPGIPRHRFKAGFDYWLTPKWKLGADLVAASDQPFFRNDVADELDRSDDLAGYTRVDLHTSYDLNKNVQLYGLIKNLFNEKYGLYGTYFDTEQVSPIDVAIGGDGLEDPRSISPSMPFAAYGGVRVKLDGTTP